MVHSNLSVTLLRDHHAHEQLEMQPQSHLRMMGVVVFLSEACRWETVPPPIPFSFGLPSVVSVTRLTVRRYLRRLAIATDGAHAAVVPCPLSKERVIEPTVPDTASDAGPSLSAAAPIRSSVLTDPSFLHFHV